MIRIEPATARDVPLILRLIRGAGKVPAERDSFYRTLRTFDEPAPAVAAA